MSLWAKSPERGSQVPNDSYVYLLSFSMSNQRIRQWMLAKEVMRFAEGTGMAIFWDHETTHFKLPATLLSADIKVPT